MGTSILSPSGVKEFYDRFGARQDRQAFYEDRALEDLLVHADLPQARTIVELGCGTGRLAKQILALSPHATYQGFEVSITMLKFARQALATFDARTSLHQLDPGTVRLPVPDRSVDRLISTYVLDLLAPGDIATFFQDALRILTPGGRLCLVSLTRGTSLLSRFIAGVWSAIYNWRPALVGGCRPIELLEYCGPASWAIVRVHTIVSWGIPSEVLVARPHAA